MFKTFDDVRRLGLSPEWEAKVRAEFPKETGMLVAEVILPGSVGHTLLEEGDVLVKVNGELLTQFIRLDAILDSSVGQKVKLLVQRGGEDIEVELEVGDLHAITPDKYVTVCGASFHDLSYQVARYYAVGLKKPGVYCCEATGSFRFDGSESGWLIQSIDNKPTPDLDTFIEVMNLQAPPRYAHSEHEHSVHGPTLEQEHEDGCAKRRDWYLGLLGSRGSCCAYRPCSQKSEFCEDGSRATPRRGGYHPFIR
jgi:hypothetical protein